MDPLTLATIALALIATKATEKIGEKLGEGALTEGRKALALLQHKSPDTAKRLAAASDPTVIDAELVEDVRQVANQEPEVKAAFAAVAKAAAANPVELQRLTQLAEKIGVVNLGKVENQTNHITL
jgi:tryptophan 2,3-dioxygenase